MGRDLFSFFSGSVCFFFAALFVGPSIAFCFWFRLGNLFFVFFFPVFLLLCFVCFICFFASLLRCFSFFCFLFFLFLLFCFVSLLCCFFVFCFFASLLWFYTPSCLVQIQFFTYATFLFLLVNTSHVFLNFTRSWWGNPNHTHISRSYPIICHFIDTQPLTKTPRSMFLPRTFFPPNHGPGMGVFSRCAPRSCPWKSLALQIPRIVWCGCCPRPPGQQWHGGFGGIFWRPKTIWP